MALDILKTYEKSERGIVASMDRLEDYYHACCEVQDNEKIKCLESQLKDITYAYAKVVISIIILVAHINNNPTLSKKDLQFIDNRALSARLIELLSLLDHANDTLNIMSYYEVVKLIKQAPSLHKLKFPSFSFKNQNGKIIICIKGEILYTDIYVVSSLPPKDGGRNTSLKPHQSWIMPCDAAFKPSDTRDGYKAVLA